MGIIKKVLWELFAFCTPYVDPFEFKVNRFCSWVTSYRSKFEVEKRLTALMQKNLIVTSVWLEKKYKNYAYLTKGTRRRLYKNARLMMSDFDRFVAAEGLVELAENPKDYIGAIMQYFSPARGKYIYKEGMSFGKLLANPANEQYIGDCNQIVTLYAAFFTRKFRINELQIKLIPGHVCLHLHGDDIEATNGTWKKYEKFDYIAPITELVATNLLDIAEQDEKTDSIEPEVFVKSSQLALALSQKRDIVEHNLKIAYHNLCARALERGDLSKALFYAKKLQDQKLLNACYAAEYNKLAERVRTVKTVPEAKTKKDVYRRMRELADAMHNAELATSVQKILDQIRNA